MIDRATRWEEPTAVRANRDGNSGTVAITAGVPASGKGNPLVRANTLVLLSPRQRLTAQALHLESKAVPTLRRVALPGLRILIGVLFIWFGALKVLGVSPVEALVTATLPFAPPHLVMLTLGSFELIFGSALALGFLTRFVLPLLAAHLTGTFLTFVMVPAVMFDHKNPLLLTTSGEFVMKNFVLIAAMLVLFAYLPRKPTA
jgi:putative oxidoreductase